MGMKGPERTQQGGEPSRLLPGRFFGTAEPARSARDLEVSMSAYPAASRLPTHAHTTPYLSFVVAGGYVEHVGGRAVDCRALTVRYHPPGEEHADSFGAAGGRCLNLELGDCWRESVERLPDTGRPPMLLDSAAWLGLRAVSEYRAPDASSALVLEALAAELLGACEETARLRRAAERSAAVRRALELVEDCADRRLTLGEIAAAAGLHPTHLARSFRALTGLTVGDYVRRRRVARAQARLLADGAATISRVAADSGFADHAHLTRCFRRVTGATPSRYRALLGEVADTGR
jgi:AraC family transcriptional regulator